MRISEQRISQIIRETINEQMFGNVDHFTPYSKEEAEQNKKAIGHVGNPSYDKFKAWRDEQLANGVPSRECGFNAYKAYLSQNNC